MASQIGTKRPHYTPEEDATLLTIIGETEESGYPMSTGYVAAAEALEGRDAKSVEVRYKKLIKLLETPDDGKYPDLQKLLIKVHVLSKTKSRSNEKVDHYKGKYEALKAEHSDLLRMYKNLESEHRMFVESIKLALDQADGIKNEQIEMEYGSEAAG